MLAHWYNRWGIRTQMTLSYIWVTVLSVVVLQILAFIINGFTIRQLTVTVVRTGLVALVVMAPIGSLFSLISTHRIVDRIRRLVSATTRFADGDYSKRVQVVRSDEVGQLEEHFNRMAAQLDESIAQRQALAEQNARMQERARISRELHDAISQELFSIRTLANGLHAAIQVGAPAQELEPHIALLEQITITITREMRALLLEMRPPQLEGLCFAEAIAVLADAYTTRLGIAVTTAISPVVLGADEENALLRITQEAFTNSARHSNATLIHLELASKGEMAVLSVADNGQGFDPTLIGHPYGLGLHLMEERANELGGHFSLNSAPGQGTRIEVQVPQEINNDTSRDCR